MLVIAPPNWAPSSSSNKGDEIAFRRKSDLGCDVDMRVPRHFYVFSESRNEAKRVEKLRFVRQIFR